MSQEKALISIIIPVYKVEKYLEKCIQSVINQTYENLQIILVDDGSPDNCGKICDEYAKKDHRIEVIHKSNGGLSDARNKGLEIAKGEYIGYDVFCQDVKSNWGFAAGTFRLLRKANRRGYWSALERGSIDGREGRVFSSFTWTDTL